MELSNTTRKDREVREVFRKLRKKYNSEVVRGFIRRNYFIHDDTLYNILKRVDNEPVTDPSSIYEAVIKGDFCL